MPGTYATQRTHARAEHETESPAMSAASKPGQWPNMPRQNKGGKKGKKAGKTGTVADPNELADMGISMRPKTPRKDKKSYMPGSDDAYQTPSQAAKSAKRTKSKSPAKKQ